MNIIQEIQICNEVKHIVVGGIVPRSKPITEKYNKELNSICLQEPFRELSAEEWQHCQRTTLLR
jgi:hypothetical protein